MIRLFRMLTLSTSLTLIAAGSWEIVRPLLRTVNPEMTTSDAAMVTTVPSPRPSITGLFLPISTSGLSITMRS